MKHYSLIILLAIYFVACNSHSHYRNTLTEVESYIEESPDSALATLQTINVSELVGKEEQAKYALLYSIALDKNFIDTTEFDILQPAIDYYLREGNSTDKLRTYYYQGRIYQNQKRDALAMKCFVNAIEEGVYSEDQLTVARVYFAQSKIYYSLYEWEDFIESNKNAADYFYKAGALNSYANCLIRIINGYTLIGDSVNASVYITECQSFLDHISLNRLRDFYSSYLTYLIEYGSDTNILKTIQNYKKAIPASKIDWLTISNSYLKIGRYNDALNSLSKCSNDIEITKGLKYQAILSEIYQHLGKYKESLEAYQKYMAASDSMDYAVLRQDTKFVEERHLLELQTLSEQESKKQIMLSAASLIFLLLGIILWIRTRLKVNRMEKAFAEQEMEKYRSMYEQMEEERDNLTNLLDQNKELSDDIKTALVMRLELLNKFFTAQITSNNEIDKKANKEMEDLLSNKDAFMKSTKFAFAGSHPKFIQYLKERNLTEWEISYCCLYALGLKGKEVGVYIKMRSHYNNSSEIREKLGINEHETNLGIYIRKLLKMYE